MVKVMYNDKLVYKVIIWVFWGISLWTDKEPLRQRSIRCQICLRIFDVENIPVMLHYNMMYAIPDELYWLQGSLPLSKFESSNKSHKC